MEIAVLDFTMNWGGVVQEAIRRWNAAIAYRDITLTYERWIPSPYQCDQGVQCIHVCDSIPRTGAALADSYVCVGQWVGSYIRFYTPPAGGGFSIAEACHELGHALMLNHDTEHPSVMTPVPSLAYPSSWDATNAMPGYPLAAPPVPPTQPPKQKKKHKKRKKH